MKTVIVIRFDSSDIPGGAKAVLERARCGPDVATVSDVPVLDQVVVWVTLEEEDPRVVVLIELLKQYGEDWYERHEDRYTEAELDSARLLFMQPNRKCEIDGGVKWGTIYDLSTGCPRCGSGATQTSAVLVDGQDVEKLEGHRGGATYHWHYLVDEALAQDLETIGATGLAFRNVYAVMPGGRQVRLRWRQLLAGRSLPPMSPRSSGFVRDRACEVCWRNGYFQTDEEPTRMVYDATDLRGAEDVNWSWEHQGFSVLERDLRASLLACPWLVVTPKVHRVLRDAGVTEFDWYPIRVADSDG